MITAILTNRGGSLQAIRWGATGRDSVITAEQPQREFDRVRLTSDSELGSAKEIGPLIDLVREEDRRCFGRVLGRRRVLGDGAAVATGSDGQVASDPRGPANWKRCQILVTRSGKAK